MSDGQLHGKQLVSGSVAEAKLEAAYTAEVFKRDGSVALTGNADAGGQKWTNLGAPTTGTDAARLQDIHDLNRKELCRVITTTNITLSGEQTINGVPVVANDRVLVGNAQTTAADRGIYVVSTGAWTRASDADTGPELTGAVVWVNEGTTGADTNYQQANTITTPGTDPQDWIDVGGPGASSQPSHDNKQMTALVTTADYDKATNATVTTTPAASSHVRVSVNGLEVTVGNGARDKSAYFSNDSGASARAWTAIQAGDELYWVGSVAGYELAATDRIDLDYNA